MCVRADFHLPGQQFGEKAPNFDNEERQAGFGQMQESHRVLLAVQALVREFRMQLKRDRLYKGSKLELMDIYGVKTSELSAWPFFVGEIDARPLPKGYYDKKSTIRLLHKRQRGEKKVAKSEISDEEAPARSDRPKRNVKKRDDDDYVE
jgi:hypothetical protein